MAHSRWLPWLLQALVGLPLVAAAATEQTAAAQPTPVPPALNTPSAEQALALDQLRRSGESNGLRRRYLNQASDLLHQFWNSREQPQLLFSGDTASGCGVKRVQHPMAFYCPTSKQIAMALNLRQSVKAARGKADRELLLLDLAVLAHEVGHHVNREQGRGPFQGGLNLTVKQEELAADWRTGVFLGWLLSSGGLTVDDFTGTANLLFEMGDYERITPQHHGYPKDRFQALTQGLATQIHPGQRLGEWTADTRETFSRPLPGRSESQQQLNRRVYEVRRFEIDRGSQIATNLVGGLLGAASCLWGSQQQCMGMALQQGKGRAEGVYTEGQLTLHCASGRFDVSNDDFDRQPISRDGKGQAAVLAARDCPRKAPKAAPATAPAATVPPGPDRSL